MNAGSGYLAAQELLAGPRRRRGLAIGAAAAGAAGVIAAALVRLSLHPGIRFESIEGLRWAAERYVRGADFDDVIHLLACSDRGAMALVTFDDDMVRQVEPGSPARIDLLR